MDPGEDMSQPPMSAGDRAIGYEGGVADRLCPVRAQAALGRAARP
jgi:hypothetical protein